MPSTRWLVRLQDGPRRLRLYCFSYAGGNAFLFLPWQAALNPAIEVCAVQLPGRGARLQEPPYSSLPLLIENLAGVISRQDPLPFAFFGHSLGALIAFELARYCDRHDLPLPLHLFPSGCDAPQYRSSGRRLHELDDRALIDALKEYNGTPQEVLENRELMELAIPTLRADFALAEKYKYQPGPALTIPITVLAGNRDDQIFAEQVQDWRKETTSTCSVKWFEGDHFFINSDRDNVVQFLNAKLAQLAIF